jgi:SAM-dependent methyltransferase
MYSTLRKFVSSRSPKFYFLKKSFGDQAFKLLDIGAGNHSASKTKWLFPNCQYFGVDLNKDYNNDEKDFAAMDGFYEMDLTKLKYQDIPESFFDAINMVHVIEHLFNGDRVIEGLLGKLKPGGKIYIEYPGFRSTKLPSMHGSLNFKDDPTHVRLYSVKELERLLTSRGFSIIKSGTRRNFFYMAVMPFRIIEHWVRGKRLEGNIFWDLLGFAEFVWARKSQ